MASHRRPKPVGRTRASILTAAAATAVALSSQTGAHADPAPTKEQVAAQVDQLNDQAEAANEQYLAAEQKQQELQKQVTTLQDQVARQQDQVSGVQGRLAEVAAQQYRDGGISPTVKLMLSSNPGEFLGQAGAVSRMSATQADTLKSFKAEQAKLDGQKAEAEHKLAELDTSTRALKAKKEDFQGKLAKAQSLLNSLTQKEKDELAAAEQRAADAARTSADRASRDTTRPDLGSVDLPSGTYTAKAIAAVKSALGAPYVYGATGPSTFDCSGLMQWAYGKAGVSIPRTSQSQAGAGTNIGTNIANAKPGDLVIYYSDRHHVGMYVGGGQVIHAPHTGAVVRYVAATAMPISAIIRV
ncbi:C40 family peptidase [Kitasatospora sp. NPDC085879]|uniref:C40 family peptidase n=1 Tax=Kitasatospora sp. NPDC085879 TaxID=3154769 RepID=UPI000BB1588F|nr:C40 family peptidase [Streptomyces sp. TLI_235]PBC72045.1 cell wall-associated NlpC family hydrolase [Streptomyces sp. TLI_235]